MPREEKDKMTEYVEVVIAVLEELQKEVDELCISNPMTEYEEDMNRGIEKAVDVIQQKINELKWRK